MHEPSDVTIELDGLGRQLSELPSGPKHPQKSGSAEDVDQESSDGPVFVDASGRRSKKFRRAGWILAAVCACYAVTLVVALMGGNSSAPWLNIPGVKVDKKSDSVKVEKPAPSGSAADGVLPGGPSLPVPTDSNGSPIPGTSASATTGASGIPAPGASGSAKPPKQTAGAPGKPDPGNSVPAGGSDPGGPTTTDAPPETTPPVETPPDTPTPPVETTDAGTEPAGPPAGDPQAMAAEGAQ